MDLYGKLIGHVEVIMGISATSLGSNPNKITVISSDKVHGCDFYDGEREVVGSIISWLYTHEGKKKTSKQINEAANDIQDLYNHTKCLTKKVIVFTVIGGDLVDEIYMTFTIILNVATWAFEFEKPDISVPYPTSMMDYLCDLVKDLDTYSNTK
uniref:Bet v I/Major latex protein domain-containing protein n=1 Tax=Lactuca sativa TaxID=4236 RepID=A0A9R1XB53_LACSA|nr:hypothetical protein LSAT_V11C500288180 [Lactuca sativa]